MPLSGTPAPYKRKKSSKIITDLSHITQDVDQDETDPEATEFDLGTKIKVPKDVMLEELALLTNKGSKMFKKRQQRVERFIYENNPDPLSESTENLHNLVPSLDGQVTDGNTDAGDHANASGNAHAEDSAPAGSDAPESDTDGKKDESGEGAGEEGGEEGGQNGVNGVDDNATEQEKEKESEKEMKEKEIVRTYISPWERAMRGDTELTATMKMQMPGPQVYQAPPSVKSFNRTALPYGGFEKASQLMTFQMPDLDMAPEEPEQTVVYHLNISSRPSFNRTPIGWVCSGEHSDVFMEQMEDLIPFDGETDDL